MRKFAIFIITFLMSAVSVYSKNLDMIVKNSEISKTATVAVSLRNLNNGHVVYENESKKLLHPASTLKAFTTPVILNQLGNNYNFKTQIYRLGDDVYLKLSADPYLTSKDLRSLITSLRGAGIKQIEHFYIDDSVIDDEEYGIGWMWDDEILTFMPKYSKYNLDGNIFTLTLTPSNDKKTINIKKPNNYNVIAVNKLKSGAKNNVTVHRNFWEGVEKVTLTGTLSSQTTVKIPVYNPKRYFVSVIQDILNTSNINYYGSFEAKQTPAQAVLVKEFETPINTMYSKIYKNSNNMISETLFKLAGGKYKHVKGSTEYAVEAFEDYYKNIGVDTSGIIVVDGSGVSRNDLLSTDWMSESLYKINKNDKNFNYKERFNIPNEGTLNNRLFELRDYLWAKTGTLANISGLTGYITTKKGNQYSFAILIQNTIAPDSEAKKLEDEIITTIYNNY